MATIVSLLMIVGCLASFRTAATGSLPSLKAEGEGDGEGGKFEPLTELEQRWQSFKEEFGKKYNEVEEEFRRKIFLKKLEEIELHNYLYSKGLKTFTMGINQFSDLEFSEFLQQMTGYIQPNITDHHEETDFSSSENETTVPCRIDWRTKGYVTRVKNQGHCGSCWAFSSTGALEGQYRRKTGRLVELSEQNLIDCTKRYGNRGCKGGWMEKAFKYIAENDGIDTESSYPYEAKDGYCRFKRWAVGTNCIGYSRIEGGEKNLKIAVANYGPVSVAIDVTKSFQSYESGVYYEPTCSTRKLNHAVLAVGYGRTDDGIRYWIVKNSWGTSWGDGGYILMSRFRNNNCGIATEALVPLV